MQTVFEKTRRAGLPIGLRRSAILAAFLLAACGQRGPLYLPKVPPLPPPPDMQTAPSEATDTPGSAGQTGSAGIAPAAPRSTGAGTK